MLTMSANLSGTDKTPVRGSERALPYGAWRNAERAAGGRADAALAKLDAAHLLLMFNISRPTSTCAMPSKWWLKEKAILPAAKGR